jgi:hypothetical protein
MYILHMCVLRVHGENRTKTHTHRHTAHTPYVYQKHTPPDRFLSRRLLYIYIYIYECRVDRARYAYVYLLLLYVQYRVCNI